MSQTTHSTKKHSLPMKGVARPAAVLRAIDQWLARYGWLLLIGFAILYYGQYYRSGLNLGGEGGTDAVIALRLMEGQRPIVDTFLGYNVMWFYPITWLFHLTGPNYIALRLFFFSLCTVSGVLAFLVLRGSSKSGVLAVLISGIVVVIPGMLFRNYMPFLGMLNMYLLLQAYVFRHRSSRIRIAWIIASGLGLGLTFLFRVDLGIFYSAIAAGLMVLSLLGFEGNVLHRLKIATFSLAASVAMIFVTHWPVYQDAKARGFSGDFLAQYTAWFQMIGNELHEKLGSENITPPPQPLVGSPDVHPESSSSADDSSVEDRGDKSVLQRTDVAKVLGPTSFYDRAFVIITYLPIVLSGVLVIGFSVIYLVALFRRNEAESRSALIVLTAIGCALALFPQFFFFRPDTPHLSEFMVPFLVALGCASWQVGVALQSGRWFSLIFGIIVLPLSVTNAALYVYHAYPKASAGTIAAARKCSYEMVADNGVKVLLKKKDRDALQALHDTIVTHSDVNDYVVCYPYAPTINFMTNRRSYEYNLYVDNATAPANFYQESLNEIAKYRPAAIVIDNRKINQTESSCFSNWAAKTYAFIREKYHYAGTFGRQEVFLRPDKVGGALP
jgi:hypothetical protein